MKFRGDNFVDMVSGKPVDIYEDIYGRSLQGGRKVKIIWRAIFGTAGIIQKLRENESIKNSVV